MLRVIIATCVGAMKKAQLEHKKAKAIDESLMGLHDENMSMRSQLHEYEMRETRTQKDHERCGLQVATPC